MTRIEQIIDDIETFIDNCKYQTFSNTSIIVNKGELMELVSELRMRVPEEIKKYQKITSQQDAILSDARSQAQNVLADAQQQANDIVSEHEIVRLAQERAAEIEDEARIHAEEMVAYASEDSNRIRRGAIEYTDKLLERVMNAVKKADEENQACQNNFISVLGNVYNECDENREELKKTNIYQGQ